jgi:hypothetical protein
MVSVAGPHRFRDYGTFVDDLIRGDLVVVTDAGTDEAQVAWIPALRPVVVDEHHRHQPPALDDRHVDRPQRWDPGDLRFIRTAADRIQAAVARARAEERPRRSAR